MPIEIKSYSAVLPRATSIGGKYLLNPGDYYPLFQVSILFLPPPEMPGAEINTLLGSLIFSTKADVRLERGYPVK